MFPHRLLPKHEGAGLYLEIAPRHVWYGGGLYMPTSQQLHLLREHIAAHHRRLSRILASPAFRRAFGSLEGDRLQRVPRGFAKDHPAAEWLKYRQYLAFCERPAEFALTPGFYRNAAHIMAGDGAARRVSQRAAGGRAEDRHAGHGMDRRRLVTLAAALAAVIVALPQAQVRLADEADREAFRAWFTFLADAQFYRATPDVTDCAGLVRHAVREALRAHTPEWRRAAGLPLEAPYPDVRSRPPGRPTGGGCFASGRTRSPSSPTRGRSSA